MRVTPPPSGIGVDDHFPERPLDLVLAHHSLQFPPSRWKRVRERITAGNAARELQTAGVPDGDLPTDEEIDSDHAARDHREHRDVLHQRLHAETLFLTGSAAAFREQARHFFALAKDGPPAAAGNSLYLQGGCNHHVCRGFDWTRREPRANNRIHVEYCPRWTR